MIECVDVAIIGGGVSGLAAAYRARADGAIVALCDAAPKVGGVVSTARYENFQIERATTSMSATPAIRALLDALGLAPDIVTPSEIAHKRYIVRDGVMHALPSGLGALLRTSLLSTRAKLRLCAEPFIRRRHAVDDDETLGALARRRLGPEVLDYLIDPFVSGVCAGDADNLSSRYTMRSLAELEQAHGSILLGALKQAISRRNGMDRSSIVSFARGMQQLPDALADALEGSVFPNTCVETVSRDENHWELSCRHPHGTQTIRARALVCAVPAHALLRINWPGEWSEHIDTLARVRYAPILTVSLGFQRCDVAHALDGFGVLFPRREGRALLGALFNSSMFSGRAGPDHVLVTAFAGGVRSALPPTNTAAVSEALEVLAPLLGIRGAPVMTAVSRWTEGIPQLEPGHEQVRNSASAIEIAEASVFFIGSYLGGVAMGDCLESGMQAGKKAAAAAHGLCSPVLQYRPATTAAV